MLAQNYDEGTVANPSGTKAGLISRERSAIDSALADQHRSLEVLQIALDTLAGVLAPVRQNTPQPEEKDSGIPDRDYYGSSHFFTSIVDAVNHTQALSKKVAELTKELEV